MSEEIDTLITLISSLHTVYTSGNVMLYPINVYHYYMPVKNKSAFKKSIHNLHTGKLYKSDVDKNTNLIKIMESLNPQLLSE
jgi:hypothetical protein